MSRNLVLLDLSLARPQDNVLLHHPPRYPTDTDLSCPKIDAIEVVMTANTESVCLTLLVLRIFAR